MGDSQKTNIKDSSVSGNGVSASKGSTINFLSADVAMDALDTAVELGKASISQSGNVLAGILNLADRNATITESSRVGNENLVRDLATQTAEERKPADVQVLGTVGKYAAWIVGGIAMIFGLFFLFRSKPKN